MKRRLVLMALLSATALLPGCSRSEKVAAVAPAAGAAAPQTPNAEAAVAPADLMQKGYAALAAGRFDEAAEKFTAAAAAGPNPRSAKLGLALANLGLRRTDETAGLLSSLLADANGDSGTDSDLGLALALAGQPHDAIEVLEKRVAKAGDRRARQNLAFAYAMAGDFARAQETARIDLLESDVERSMADWKALVHLQPAERLAGFLGVPLPAQATAPVQVAVAAPPPAVTPIMAPAVGHAALLAADQGDNVKTPAELPRKAATGPWIVQIAAFKSALTLEDAVGQIRAKHGAVLAEANARMIAPRGPKDFHRLVLGGYANRTEAMEACGKLRAAGLNCFIRKEGQSWAAKSRRKTVTLAAKQARTLHANAQRPSTKA